MLRFPLSPELFNFQPAAGSSIELLLLMETMFI